MELIDWLFSCIYYLQKMLGLTELDKQAPPNH